MIDSAVMAGFGIVQRGASILRRPAQPVILPDEGPFLVDALDRMYAVAALARSHHPFAGGMGLAAPQIGVARAIAIIQRPVPADGFVTLVNPMVLGGWDVTIEFEGCLSFFDVRGSVPRASRLAVSYQLADGSRLAELFHGSLARLVAHEIDHLNGLLYTDRMEPEALLLPVAEYRLRRCVELSG